MKRSIFRSGSSQGFTLIEIMIAVFLIVVVMMGVISVTAMVIKGNSFSKMMTTATTLAKDKMEQLKNDGYDALVTGSDTQESIYNRTWTVANDTPAAGMKTVVVTVAWNWQGTSHNAAVRSIIAE